MLLFDNLKFLLKIWFGHNILLTFFLQTSFEMSLILLKFLKNYAVVAHRENMQKC